MVGPIEIGTYDLFNTLGLFAAIIFNLCLYHEKTKLLSAYTQIRLKADPKTIISAYVVLEIIILTFAQNYIGGIFNGFWAKLLSGGGGNYFGLLYLSIPFFCLFCVLLRVNPLKQLDLYTPSYAVTLIFVKIACFLHGCCHGKTWDLGLYYVVRGRYEFPAQLLEAAVALILAIILTRMLRKQRTPGTLFPIYLILYSSIRFFTEFTRTNDVVCMGLQLYQIQCIVGVLLGIVELKLAKKYGRKWSDAFDRKQEAYIQKKLKENPKGT